MDTQSFESLCAEAVDEPRAHGFERQGVRVELVYAPSLVPGRAAVVLFEVGPVQLRDLQARTMMETLLAAGFVSWRRADKPLLGCDPRTGAAVLQCVHPILDAAPGALAELVEDGVALALELREDLLN